MLKHGTDGELPEYEGELPEYEGSPEDKGISQP